MSYDGETFTYDEIGNPTKYRDVSLTWEKGRQLKKYGNIEYSYNASGIRTKKVNGNAITEYYLDGSQILAQKDIVVAGDNTQVETMMHFVYGLDGISGFTINNQNYYYKKNLQGDIIGIYDNNLNLIVKYDYDAWGEHKIYYLDNGNFVDFDLESTYTNTSNTNLYIALKNPFRYRGYYYDTETGLYYLNSRYYDPEICRFINADDISVLSEGKEFLNGLNLFSYCNNNPIMNIDNSGYAWWDWLVGIAVIVAAVVVSVATAGIGTAITASLGGGLAASMLGGAVGGAISGAIISAGISIGTQMINNGVGNVDWSQVGMAALTGAASGFVLGGIGGAVRYFSTTTKLYRAVSNAEYQSIKSTGKFSLQAGGFEGKQFAFKLSEVKKYAGLPLNKGMYSSIVSIRVPNSVLNNIMQKTMTDMFVFKSGIGTIVDLETLNKFMEIIKFIKL